MTNTRRIALIALPVAALAFALAGCGGGDDLNDIRQTATAAAQRTPAAQSPTADPAETYRARASALSGELVALLQTLHDDLLAAQATQADPKWPGVLTADADLVSAKARSISSLSRPASVAPTLTSEVKGTADSCASAADLLKAAVMAADPTSAAQAVAALEAANASMLDLLPQLVPTVATPTP